MQANGSDDYHWRETYFILFDSLQRPSLDEVSTALGSLSKKYQLNTGNQDEEGRFESITVNSPDDNAALEISFESGEAVIEQGTELAKQLKDEAEPEQLALLIKADARLDVMHFEHLAAEMFPDDDEFDEALDPSCLLLVVDALVGLTGGLPIDPASGAILP